MLLYSIFHKFHTLLADAVVRKERFFLSREAYEGFWVNHKGDMYSEGTGKEKVLKCHIFVSIVFLCVCLKTRLE